MSYDLLKREFGKQKIYVVEMDLPYCDLDFSVSPCTATGAGDAKCYNTLASCQDVPNFTTSLKTYRFCESVSPHPPGIDAIPNLKSVSITPSQIQLEGGLGIRSNLSLSFNDHPASDLGVDKYVSDRTYIAMERGTFWQKFRARNPFYKNAAIRLKSGYLDNGVYDPANFITYHFVIESLDVSNGQCSIKAKDPLKLADNSRAQAPRASIGELNADVTDVALVATLTPTGVGDLEYPASGFVRIASEVIGFTRTGDVLTITRGEYNTLAIAHRAGDKVQLCLEYNDQVNVIVGDLLVNYAGIDIAFIPTAKWQAEIDDTLSGLLSTLITEPVGVTELLKELGEQAPHSLYWDERAQLIQLQAIKRPPTSARVYDEDGDLISESVTVKDEQKMRKSTIFVYYGQIDPTKKLDETNNYYGTYVRADVDSIAKYGGNEIKTIYSRWISRTNKAAAIVLAARTGRRFADVPRAITFELDPRVADQDPLAMNFGVWAGQTIAINHRFLSDFSGLPSTVIFQLITAQETDNFRYTGLEYTYGQSLDQDEGADDGVDLIVLDGDLLDYNLRADYDTKFPEPTLDSVIKVVIEGSARVGGSVLGQPSFITGIFPVGATITIEVRGLLVGRGGKGQSSTDGDLPEAGSLALELQHPVTINNLGIIGGGGGGGGKFGTLPGVGISGGGGGAGFNGGLRGIGTGGLLLTQSQNGANTVGGAGERRLTSGQDPEPIDGGDGGGLGQVGNISGGAAGDAIKSNGNAITYINAGDIRGAIT